MRLLTNTIKITFVERNRPKIGARFLSLDAVGFNSETPSPVAVSSSNGTSCGGNNPLLYLEMTICESYNSRTSWLVFLLEAARSDVQTSVICLHGRGGQIIMGIHISDTTQCIWKYATYVHSVDVCYF